MHVLTLLPTAAKDNLLTGAVDNENILSTTGWMNELHQLYHEMYAL